MKNIGNMKRTEFKVSDLILVKPARVGPDNFNTESKVMLRSGGPVMVILELFKIDALCVWFNMDTLNFEKREFKRCMLDLVM